MKEEEHLEPVCLFGNYYPIFSQEAKYNLNIEEREVLEKTGVQQTKYKYFLAKLDKKVYVSQRSSQARSLKSHIALKGSKQELRPRSSKVFKCLTPIQLFRLLIPLRIWA